MSIRADEALQACDAIVGYPVYVDLVRDRYPGKELHSTPMTRETERCQLALELARMHIHSTIIERDPARCRVMKTLLPEATIICADGPFGPLTVIGGRIYMEDGRIFQTMDSRYPTCTDGDAIAAKIRAAIGTGAELTDVGSAKPFYIEADTPAIKACIDTYNEVTGENATPFTMGGGTYARHFPYAVSFGPEHNDVQLPSFGGPMHGANESAPIDKLLEAMKIYILALLRLEEIDF